jgi:hypothetical protein
MEMIKNLKLEMNIHNVQKVQNVSIDSTDKLIQQCRKNKSIRMSGSQERDISVDKARIDKTMSLLSLLNQ